MPDDSLKLEDISTSLEALGRATDEVSEKHNRAARFQVVIAVIGVLLTFASVWNNWKISRLGDAQDKLSQMLTEQQSEINIGTSVLHETMLILDTGDKAVLKEKVTAQVSLILTLMNQSAAAGRAIADTDLMQHFYAKLLDVLLAALPRQDAQELHRYIDDQTAEPGDVEPAAAAGAVPAPDPAAPAAPQAFSRGEAASPGTGSKDYDVFWCVGDTPYPELNANESVAEAIYRGLVARQAAAGLGRIRLRRLPEFINQTAGFWIRPGTVTVRSSAAKPADAAELQAWVGADLHAAHQDQTVTLGTRGSSARGPLDVFACPS
jgi:hypothetical protein